MCLTISRKYHEKDEQGVFIPLKAEEDIHVFKNLDDNKETGTWETPFRGFEIKFSEGKFTFDETTMVQTGRSVNEGLHAYGDSLKALYHKILFMESGQKTFDAVIPKGSLFFLGDSETSGTYVVSNNLTIYQTHDYFLKDYPEDKPNTIREYCEKYGFDTFLLVTGI